jgi:hypothetical protein
MDCCAEQPVRMTDVQVRNLRDIVYGHACSDENWVNCKNNWMRPQSTIWLLEKARATMNIPMRQCACGGKPYVKRPGGEFQVRCRDCHASTGCHPNEFAASLAWNSGVKVHPQNSPMFNEPNKHTDSIEEGFSLRDHLMLLGQLVESALAGPPLLEEFMRDIKPEERQKYAARPGKALFSIGNFVVCERK